MEKNLPANLKDNGPFFQKDEQGKDIYYPWGNAGEAYYINQKQKFTLKASYALITILLISATLLGQAFSGFTLQSLAVVFFNILMFSWLVFFYFFSQSLRIKQAPSLIERKSPRVVKELSIAFVALLIFIAWGFLVDASDPLFGILLPFVLVVYPLLILFVQRKQGYIFQKIPSSSDGHH